MKLLFATVLVTILACAVGTPASVENIHGSEFAETGAQLPHAVRESRTSCRKKGYDYYCKSCKSKLAVYPVCVRPGLCCKFGICVNCPKYVGKKDYCTNSPCSLKEIIPDVWCKCWSA